MKEKNQRTLAIWALAIALCATTVAYAILQTTLTISGSVTKKGGTWDISFVDVGWVAGEELTTAPAVSGTSLNFGVTLNEPGDYVVIGFKVKNNGSVNAVTDYDKQISSTGNLTISSGNFSNSSKVTFSDPISAAGVSCTLAEDSSMSTFDEWVQTLPIESVNSGVTTNIVYLKCRYDDVNNDTLSSSDATINVTYTIEYKQA